MNKNYRILFCLISFLSIIQSVKGQNLQKEVLDQLLDFHSTQKEIAYLHLNKSLLLKGEQLGFSAYILNPNGFKPSKKTTNLYVQIKDANDVVVKEKMLLIENGTGASTFDIDSTFSSGTYSITAFTNWMRNFKQRYFFEEAIQVIGSNLENEISTKNTIKIDAQFLPESGHLLNDINNNLGIVIKDSLGYGLSNAKVRVLTRENKPVGNTRLNKFGIGEISFVADASEKYKALIDYKGKTFTEDIATNIESKGIIISTNFDKEKVEVSLNTNTETMEAIGKNPYIFSIQNNSGVITYQVKFQSQTSIVFSIPFQKLKPGINIFTLFNEDKKAVAERLFFNYKDLPVFELGEPLVKKSNDSLQILLPTAKFSDSTFLSVSILPQNTIANKRNNNIASYFLLQPYVKGSIEDGSWYFEDVDTEKKLALDQLLLTQGWSSYDWGSIFNKSDGYPYSFEKYVDLKATINNRKGKEQRFLIHASMTNDPTFIDIPEGKDSFILEGIKPIEGENFNISRVKIKKNDNLLPADLAIQSFPSTIESFNPKVNILPQKSYSYSTKPDPYFYNLNNFGNDVEQLGEVVINAKVDKEKIRERKLNNHSWGKVDVLEDRERQMYGTLGRYLTGKGFHVIESSGKFHLSTMISESSSIRHNKETLSDKTFPEGSGGRAGAEPGKITIFINDIPVVDESRLYRYSLNNVDYIEINKRGMGAGFLGASGSVKIYTDYDMREENSISRTRIQKFDFPLAYARNKRFYVPKYSNETDDFFSNTE